MDKIVELGWIKKEYICDITTQDKFLRIHTSMRQRNDVLDIKEYGSLKYYFIKNEKFYYLYYLNEKISLFYVENNLSLISLVTPEDFVNNIIELEKDINEKDIELIIIKHMLMSEDHIRDIKLNSILK